MVFEFNVQTPYGPAYRI